MGALTYAEFSPFELNPDVLFGAVNLDSNYIRE